MLDLFCKSSWERAQTCLAKRRWIWLDKPSFLTRSYSPRIPIGSRGGVSNVHHSPGTSSSALRFFRGLTLEHLLHRAMPSTFVPLLNWHHPSIHHSFYPSIHPSIYPSIIIHTYINTYVFCRPLCCPWAGEKLEPIPAVLCWGQSYTLDCERSCESWSKVGLLL